MTKERINKTIEIFNRAICSIAKIIIIVIVLFLILELLSIAVYSIYFATHGYYKVRNDVYEDQAWAKEFYEEYVASSVMEYSAYVGYQRKPNFKGKYINVNAQSLRRTRNGCNQSKNNTKIWLFGGSTLWGYGARDDYTIPSHVSKYLCENGVNVQITNFGEDGYVRTQQILRLILELKKGKHPDIVIFYDGVNDVFSAWQNGIPGLPQNIQNRQLEFNSKDKWNILRPLMNTNFMNLLNDVIVKKNQNIDKQRYARLNEMKLVSDLKEDYFASQEITENLAEQYEFKVIFILQPLIYTKKELSLNEVQLVGSKKRADFFLQAYDEFQKSDMTFVDMSDIFKGYNETLYLDFAHLSEKGNSVIGKEIGKIITEIMANKIN